MRCFKLVISFAITAILATGFISAESESYVKVIYLSGKAEFLKSGKVEWEDIEKGISLYSGDSIKTHKDSFVEIAFGERKKNIINIRPDTYVVLKLQDPERIELIDGEVFSMVKWLPRGSTFEIRTPTAICGARGTGWGTEANKGKSIVSAYENDSYVKGINEDGTLMEKTIIKEGYQTIVERFKRPSELMKISEKNFERWHEWKDNVAERLSAGKTTKEKLSGTLGISQDESTRMEDKKSEDRLRKTSEEKGAGGGKGTGTGTSGGYTPPG